MDMSHVLLKKALGKATIHLMTPQVFQITGRLLPNEMVLNSTVFSNVIQSVIEYNDIEYSVCLKCFTKL